MNRTDFPILKETVHKRQLVYLDNAATSQKPQSVIDAIAEAYTHWNSNIHRGVHHLSQIATSHHEAARQAVADFIGAKSSDEISSPKARPTVSTRWRSPLEKLLSKRATRSS